MADQLSVYDIVIVGAGAYGTAVLGQISLRQIPKGVRPFRILVLERTGDLGPGMPYSEQMTIRDHIVNTTAGGIQITSSYIPRPEKSDFLMWLSCLAPERREKLGISEEGVEQWRHRAFPRFVVGLYLSNRFRQFVEKLRTKGFEVNVQKWSEVTSVTPTKVSETNGYELDIKGSESVFAKHLFIATGHWVRNRFPNIERWFPSPFPPKTIQDVVEHGSDVGILGCFLSAIDTLLTICDKNGSFRWVHKGTRKYLDFIPFKGAEDFKVSMYGRTSPLPKVQGVFSRISIHKYLTADDLSSIMKENDGFLPLTDFWDLLKKEIFEEVPSIRTHLPEDWETITLEEASSKFRSMRRAAGQLVTLSQDVKQAKASRQSGVPLPLQSCFFYSYAVFHESLNFLSAEDRIRFEETKAEVSCLVSPIPVENAEKILSLMKCGFLKVRTIGKKYNIRELMHKQGILLSWTSEDGSPLEARHDYMIDATGQKGDFGNDPSPLTQSLKNNRLIKENLVPFRNTQEFQKLQDHPCVVERDGVPYFRPPGALIDFTNYSLVPESAASVVPIYYMGPNSLGQLVFPYFMAGVVTAAERAVEDLIKRGVLEHHVPHPQVECA